MYTDASVMFMYCETPLHVGSGTSLGVVDLPIQRERYTNFPNIAGGGIKGAVRDWFETSRATKDKKDEITIVFGPDKDGSEHAGAISFTEARLLLFPVRSMRGLFAWVTCPSVLARLKRDMEIVGKGFTVQQEDKQVQINIPSVKDTEAYGAGDCYPLVEEKDGKNTKERVVLEEYVFDLNPQNGQSDFNNISKWLVDHLFPEPGGQNSHDPLKFWRDRFQKSLLVLSENDFSEFVQHSTDVNARVKIGEGKSTDTKKGGNLFYEENLPMESVMYSLVLASNPHKDGIHGMAGSSQVLEFIVNNLRGKRAQFGGDETLGRGIMRINFL